MATAVSTPLRPIRGFAALKLWHLLSLDAPCVAALWTCFLAHQFRTAQTIMVPLALALAVWLLYAGDRIYDGIQGEAMQQRHLFHLEHQPFFLVAMGAVALLLAVVMVQLPPSIRFGWLLLALPLSLYVAAVHWLRWRRVPKEPLVALFFALATALPLAQNHGVPHGRLAAVTTLFGGLCWLNCAAIARWENTLHQADCCTAWIGRNFPSAVHALLLLSAPLLFLPQEAAIGLSIMAAAAFLYFVDRVESSLEKTTLRALADAALLTPLIVWPVGKLLSLR